MTERTEAQIIRDYIGTTQEMWDAFINDRNKLYGKMKSDLNIPGRGEDVFSSKAEILWDEFKGRTTHEWEKYKTELNLLKIC